MKPLTLLIIVGVIGGGIFYARRAFAAPTYEGPSPGAGASGVRHGIRFEGCEHFEFADRDAARAWAEDNAYRFIRHATKSMDEILADPEAVLIDVFTALFPECPWPPPSGTTFGPERMTWTEAMAEAITMARGYQAAPAEPGQAASVPVATLLAFAFGPRGA